MQNTHPHQEQFLITIDTQNHGDLDPTIMRTGIEQAVDIARREGMLTKIDDETTEIGAITVSNASAAETLILMLSDRIAATPEARRAAERAVAGLLREFPRDRIVLLTEEERTLLIEGMTLTRKSWESSAGDWIADVVANGYDGYAHTPDIMLLEAAFCENSILRNLGIDADRLGVLRILVRPEVIDIICSPERSKPVCDFEEFCRDVEVATSTMTGLVGTTALREHRREAPLLENLIVQRLAARLGLNEEEDVEPGEAPAPLA